MENATKALIIAASVLIAIVLIGLGIKLLSSTSDTEEAATKTGEALGVGLEQATSSLLDKMNSNTIGSMDDATFNNYIKDKYSGIKTGTEVLELCNLLVSKYGSVHKDHNVVHVTCGDMEINSSNIFSKVEKAKEYKVSFSAGNIPTIYVEEKN